MANYFGVTIEGFEHTEQDEEDMQYNRLAYNQAEGKVIHVGHIEGKVSNVRHDTKKASHTDAYISFSIDDNHIIFYSESLPEWLVDGIEVSVHVEKNGTVKVVHSVPKEEAKSRQDEFKKTLAEKRKTPPC